MADLKLARMLDTFDALAERSAVGEMLGSPERFAATRIDEMPRLSLDLANDRIGTVIWATGFRPDHSWLQVDAFDRKGRLRHDGGIVDAPGLYVLGLNFMRRRKSSFIHGAEDDVRELGEHLQAKLKKSPARAPLARAGNARRHLKWGQPPVSVSMSICAAPVRPTPEDQLLTGVTNMRPSTFFALFALAAAASGSALAADVPAPATAPVPAGAYTVDKAHTSLIFRVSHLGFSTYTGRFTRLDANLQFDPGQSRRFARQCDHRPALHRG